MGPVGARDAMDLEACAEKDPFSEIFDEVDRGATVHNNDVP